MKQTQGGHPFHLPAAQALGWLALTVAAVIVSTGVGFAQTVDSFRWTLPASVVAGNPFDAAVEAVDANGNRVTQFNGAIDVMGLVRGAAPRVLISEVGLVPTGLNFVELCNVSDSPVNLGGWRLTLYDASWPTPRLEFSFPSDVSPASDVFVASGGITPGSYPRYTYGSGLNWGQYSTVPVTVMLRDPSGQIADFFCAGGAIPASIQAPVEVTQADWVGLPAAAATSHRRVGGADGNSSADFLPGGSLSRGTLNAGLRLPFPGNWQEVLVLPSSVSLVQGRWIGTLIAPEPGTIMVRADDNAGVSGGFGPVRVMVGPPLTLSLPEHGSESAAGFLGLGRVSLPGLATTNVTVQLSASATGELVIPATVVIPAGLSSISFGVANRDDGALDGARSITVTASAPGYEPDQRIIVNDDNETAELSLYLPASMVERDGLVSSGTVQFNRPVAVDYAVYLQPSETNRIKVPPVVYVAAGRSNATFSIETIDNGYLDGPATLVIEALAPGTTSGRAFIAIHDDELPTVYLDVYTPVEEGQGFVADALRPAISFPCRTNVIVTLTSLNTNLLRVPSTAVIRAGEKSMLTSYTVLGDSASSGRELVGIRFDAPGFPPGTNYLEILDDEVTGYRVSPLLPDQVAGTPFNLVVHGENLAGYFPRKFSGTVRLEARSPLGLLPISPSAINISNASWFGQVTVSNGGWGTVLVVTDSLGRVGQSNPLNIVGPSAGGSPISDLVYDAARDQFIAGVRSTAMTNANCVVGLDPTTAQVLWSTNILGEPGKLALSDDNMSLYVGQNTTGGVVRINLSTRSMVSRFPLQRSGLLVEDMLVQSGIPEGLIVSQMENCCIGANANVAFFQNGVFRPQIVGGGAVCCGYSLSKGSVSGRYFSSLRGTIRQFSVGSGGVFVTRERSGLGYGGTLIEGGGRLYSATYGNVFNADTLELEGSFPVRGPCQLNDSGSLVHFLVTDNGQSSIRTFETSTRAPVASLALPYVNGTPKSLLRTGRGFAITTVEGRWYVVSNSLATAQATPGLQLSLSQSPAIATAGRDVLISLIVSNAGPEAVRGVKLSDVFGLPVEVRSASVAGGSCDWDEGGLNCQVPALSGGAVARVELNLSRNEAGLVSHALSAVGQTDSGWAVGGQVAFTSIGPPEPANEIVTIQLPGRLRDDPVSSVRNTASSVVFDPVTGKVLVGMQRVGLQMEGGLAVVNPTSGVVEKVVPLPHIPGAMAIAATGRILYVALENQGKVLIYDTVAETNSPAFMTTPGYFLQDMEVSPVNPYLVAVSPYYPSTPTASGRVVLYDRGVQLPKEVHSPFIEFSADGRFVFGTGANGSMPNATEFVFLRNEVVADGLIPDKVLHFGGFVSAFATDFQLAEGNAVFGSGQVVNGTALTNALRYPVSGWPSMACPHPELRRMYFLGKMVDNWVVEAFELDSARRIGIQAIPRSASWSPIEVVRWGERGLVFATREGTLCIIDPKILAEPPRLSVFQTFSTNTPQAGHSMTISLTVSNRGPHAAQGIVITNWLPLVSEFQSAEVEQGTGTATNGTWTWSVGSVAAGESARATIHIVPRRPGFSTNRWQLTASAFLPDVSSQPESLIWVDPAPGEDSPVSFDLAGVDLAFDPNSNSLFASVVGLGVLRLDARSGAWKQSIPAPVNSGKLAVSDDGEFLYCASLDGATITRIRLSTATADLAFQLDLDSDDDATTVDAMAVRPGHPDTLAVSVFRFGAGFGTHFYRDGVRLPVGGPASGLPGGTALAFDGPAVLYQRQHGYTLRFGVSSTGILSTNVLIDLVPDHSIGFVVSGGLLYLESGKVIDPSGMSTPGSFPAAGIVAADPVAQRIFFLSDPPLHLQGFDLSAPTNDVFHALPPVSGRPVRLISLGTNGLAALTDARRLIHFGPVSGTERSPEIDFWLAVLHHPVTLGMQEVITINLSNYGAWTAGRMELSNAIPAGFQFTSATSTAGDCQLVDGALRCSFSRMPSGGSARIDLSLKAIAIGHSTNTVVLSIASNDSTIARRVASVPITVSAVPQASISDAHVREGNGPGPVTFRLSLSNPSSHASLLRYFTSDGSAIAGQHYNAANGSVVVPAGATNVTFGLSLAIRGNTVPGGDRDFFLTLTNPINAEVGRQTARATILEDDYPTISVQYTNGPEGNSGRSEAFFHFSVPISTNVVTVEYTTADGTASTPVDYLARNGRLTFPPGVTNRVIRVPILGDLCPEGDETFFLQLGRPTRAILGFNEVTAKILNDETSIPAPSQLALTQVDGRWRITFRVDCGGGYELQRTDSLTDGSWVAVANGQAKPDQEVMVDDMTGNPAQQAFYRVRLTP